MKILVCCATRWELNVVKEEIKHLHLKQRLEIEYFCLWIGNFASMFHLTKKLLEERDTPFLVLNIWVCGHRWATEPCVQIAKLRYFLHSKEQIVPIICQLFPFVSCVSCDDIAFQQNYEWEPVIFDMESYGIEYVCQELQVPRVYVKVPVDSSWEETQHFDQKKALETLRICVDWEKLLHNLLLYSKN